MLQSRRELTVLDWGRQMPSTKCVAVMAGLASLALAGCSSSSGLSRYTYDSPQAAQAAGVQSSGLYVDGTGPSAEAAERAETRRPVRRAAPLAAARSEDLSARTTGARAPAEPLKPYSDEWWEKENREDARLKQKMNICRGC